MMAPNISVIIPVYNGERFIEQTVKSVIDFSFNHDVELIVVDDGSTDSTPDILKKFQNLVKLVSTSNQGESSAVNTGIENASGEILLVVSADDPIFTAHIFENVEEFFVKHPKAVALYSDWRLIDEQGEILQLKFPGHYSDQELIGNFHCQPGPGTFFKRSSAISIGGRSPRWKFVGDYDFWLRLSRLGDFGYRNEVLAQWRSHADSTSIAQRGPMMAVERVSVIEEFIKSENLPKKLSNRALSSAYLSAAQLSYFSSEVPGKLYLFKAFKSARGWPKSAKLKVVLFVLLTPFSRQAIRLIHKRRSK
jgi:glycosyltransferase involved in cell wall biosynthesis